MKHTVVVSEKQGKVVVEELLQHGTDGNNGKDGLNGANGKDGVNGKDGINGIDGIDGRDGKNGLNGTDGKDGKDGKKGDDGTDGLGIKEIESEDNMDGTFDVIFTMDDDTTRTITTPNLKGDRGSGGYTTLLRTASQQGWISYNDTTTKVISSGERTALTLVQASKIDTYAPAGLSVADFINDSKILARHLGGTIVLRINITASFSTANSGFISELDIGGTQNVIASVLLQNKLSSGTSSIYTDTIHIFTLDTFIANGATIYITPDSNMTITNINIFIEDSFIPQ